MKMKTHIFSALVATSALFGTLPTQAVQVAANGTEAQQLVQDEGYILFAYADGWDEFSEARCRQLMADKDIRKAAGNAVMMLVPIAEAPDEARRQQQESYLAGLKVPGSRSYPAIIMLHKDGGHYATLIGREVARGSGKEIAALISDRVAKGMERYRLIRQSEKAEGPARARLLFQASSIEGLVWMGKWVNEAIRQADPKNTTGIIDSLNFNAYGFANNVGKNGVKAGMEQVDKMLANPAYTPRQKQQMCAAVLGMLRRSGTLAEADAMRRYARKMKELAPGTPEGQAADRILKTWIPGLRFGGGWSPACIPTEQRAVEMEGECPIREAGTYTVRFEYTGGKMALVTHGVELYDGKKKVASDMHRGTAGHNHWQNTYTLTVPGTLKKPRVLIHLGQGDRDSHGRIIIEKK